MSAAGLGANVRARRSVIGTAETRVEVVIGRKVARRYGTRDLPAGRALTKRQAMATDPEARTGRNGAHSHLERLTWRSAAALHGAPGTRHPHHTPEDRL